MNETGPAPGEVIEVHTEALAIGGEAVARHAGLVIFVPLAAPNEHLRVRIVERKPRFARACIEEILAASPHRRTPPCAHFGECGGCQLQHLDYAAQLAAKAGFVRDALVRVGRIDWHADVPVHAAAELGYRQRAQVFVEARQGATRIGFRRAGSHELCDVRACPVLVPELDAAMQSLRVAAPDSLPSQVLLAAGDTGVTAEPPVAGLERVAIERRIAGAVYVGGADTFFQGNRLLLDALVAYATRPVGDAAGRGALAVDLFAGVGLFTVPLAQRFEHVDAVEADGRTVGFGRLNLTRNGIGNARFHHAEVATWLRQRVARRPDLVLLDPPRTGAHRLMPGLVQLRAPALTYVSCDPATLARDLATLVQGGYCLATVEAFDLFPQTFHVEVVAKLTLE